jgi:hypothetical protein
MWHFVAWVFFSVMAGIAASRHLGRSGPAWFLVGLIFSPLVAFVLLGCLGSPDRTRLFHSGTTFKVTVKQDRPGQV